MTKTTPNVKSDLIRSGGIDSYLLPQVFCLFTYRLDYQLYTLYVCAYVSSPQLYTYTLRPSFMLCASTSHSNTYKLTY